MLKINVLVIFVCFICLISIGLIWQISIPKGSFEKFRKNNNRGKYRIGDKRQEIYDEVKELLINET